MNARIAVFAASLTLSAALPAQLAWTQIPTGAGPTKGLWPGLVYATATGKCYLYGGAGGGTTSNETWEWDGNAWTQLFPATDPGERHTFGMCYDEVRNVVVLFGGSDNAYTPQGTTWEYDPIGNTWTQRTSVGPSPGARYGCRMVYDVQRQVSVLYGGWSGFGFTNETWEWDGTSWNQVFTANIPTGRDRFGFAYDLLRGRSVLFGGITSAGPSAETWEYDGVDWTPITTPTTPPARQKNYMAFDVLRGVCVMQGGQANAVQLLDCWEYDGVNWRLVPSTPTPARGENGTAYDIVRGRTVVFGGYSTGGVYTETWEYGVPSTPRVHRFGTGCAGSGGVVGLQAAPGSVPAIGTTFSMNVANLPPGGGVGYLFYGYDNYQFGGLWLPFDLSLIGWTGCRAYLAPAGGEAFTHTGGVGGVSFAIPANPSLAGVTLYAQALSFDAQAPNGQLALSNGLEIIVN